MKPALLLPGDIEFFPDSRIRYKINGIAVPGVTTITGQLPKDLTWWASGMACGELGWLNPRKNKKDLCLEAATKALEKIKGMDVDGFMSLLATAYRAHNVRKKTAADKGTAAHDWFEKYAKAAIANGGIAPNAALPPLPADPDVLNSVQLFLRFVAQHKVRWIQSEVVVGSRRYMFAGKFDAIAEMDGVIYLVDFKTSSGIYYEMHAQTAAYAIGCGEMGMEVDRRLILWVPKTGVEFKAYVVPTPLILDMKAFLAALDIYHCIQDGERIIEAAEEEVKAAEAKLKETAAA